MLWFTIYHTGLIMQFLNLFPFQNERIAVLTALRFLDLSPTDNLRNCAYIRWCMFMIFSELNHTLYLSYCSSVCWSDNPHLNCYLLLSISIICSFTFYRQLLKEPCSREGKFYGTCIGGGRLLRQGEARNKLFDL